jgi:hypothetical protein
MDDTQETIEQLQQLQAMYLERGSYLEAANVGKQIATLIQRQSQLSESKILLG